MKTIRKAFRVLNSFTVEKPEWGLTELSNKVDMDKAIVFRLLRTMKEFEIVEQNAATRLYRLGPGISNLAVIRRTFLKPLDHAASVLVAVKAEIDETIHLSQLEGDLIIVTYASQSTRNHRVIMKVGEIVPAYCTAPGLLFLAYGSDSYRDASLSGNLQRLTPHTIIERSEIEAMLPNIQCDGFSIVDETYSDQAKAISAPIFNEDGRMVGAATVLGPSFRLRGENEDHAKRLICDAATTISRAHGFEPKISPSDRSL